MLLQILEPSESNRAARFYHQRDRSRYIVRRALLRLLLARYLRCSVTDIRFVTAPLGKPGLTADLPIRFNVSASANLCLYAITTDRDVGVDLEFMEPAVDIASVSALFAPAEIELLRWLAPSSLLDVFYAQWTCKEASMKCTGQGLSTPLIQIPITFDPTGPRCTSDSCSILRLNAATGYAAAVATIGSFPQLTCWSLDP